MRRVIRPSALAAAFVVATVVLLGSRIHADELRGRVVAVADGDTITVLDASNQQHRIRLNGIDAPETGQAFSAVSKAMLSELAFGRDVVVTWTKRDQYGRIVGSVRVGDVDAGLEQLRAGLAWYYRAYAADIDPALRPIYEAAETRARTARAGLWRDPQPIAPWAYRHPSQAPAAAAAASPSAPTTAARIIGNRRSHIYHLPGCRSYSQVAERNRVYFRTEAEAVAAGYRKAQNCG